MKKRILNLGSLNLKVSPYLLKDGDLIRCLNLEKDSVGMLKKRSGYVSYLGTADGSVPVDLFDWHKDDGTTFWNYRNSGGKLWYSTQGTGDWTLCGNGTVTAGQHVGYAVLEGTMMVGFAGGTPRYTSDGTSFTTITAGAREEFTVSKFNRIWNGGTASNLFFSTQGTVSDWTTDSSSIKMPGAGKINSVFVANDRIVVSKNSGIMFTYDDYNLRQLPTDLGPTSPYSRAEVEDYHIWLTRKGFVGYGGSRPELLSNAVEKQIYNDANTGIAGTSFADAPGGIYRYDYFCAVGTVKDDLTTEEVGNCIMKYDYQLNEWSNYKFADFPSTFHTFTNNSGDEQFIFGGTGGQCYTYGGTAVSDNGQPIECAAEGVIHFNRPEQDKLFDRLWALGSPGCNAKIQIAISDSFNLNSLKWIDIGDLKMGIRKFVFPAGSRGKLLFWKLYEYSKDSRFNFYGFIISAEAIGE